MILSTLISAILQLLAFSLIPFLVYIIRKKTARGFFEYIGLKKSTMRANSLSMLLVIIIAMPVLLLSYYNPDFREIMTSPTSMTGKYSSLGFGLTTVALIIIEAGIKTSLAEEILFRGFLAKRLIAITSFQTGNILQAVFFGAVHAALFATVTTNSLFLFVIFFFPGLAAYFKVYLNEKMANGSILPGWIAHGVGNLVAYSGGALLF